MPKLQNFAVTRANDEAISVAVDSDVVGDTLDGKTVHWNVYDMVYAVPIASPILIAKSSADGGIGVPGTPDLYFVINLNSVDTRDLDLGNYYHEADIIDEVGNKATILYGALALTLEVME